MPKAKASAAAKKPKKTQNHKLAEKFPTGEVLKDLCKKEWSLGDVVGQGGFGLIYLASEKGSQKTGPYAEYVVKIEPIKNGPLFCELHFYQRVAKPDLIDDWIKSRKLKYLGVPKYVASGQHLYQGNQYRFMVMQRFSSDLQMIFEGAGKRFSEQTVFALALRIIDALEYLHENNYVHADMKASNCLLGYKSGKVEADKVYLVDYGLASKYAPNDEHRPYKEDPRKAHDGTIEFTSRDAHKGVDPSRRADMEILGYCLLQWLCGQLPWEDRLDDKDYVGNSKVKYMNDIPSLMRKCFAHGNAPSEITNYLGLVKNLKYDDKPNYNQMRDIFTKGLSRMGAKDKWRLALPVAGGSMAISSPKTPGLKKPGQKRVIEAAADDVKNAKSPRPSTPKTTSRPQTPKGAAAAKAASKATSPTPKASVQARAGTPKATASRKKITSPTPAGGKKTAPAPAAQKKVRTKVTVNSPSRATVNSPSRAASKAAKVGIAALSPLADRPKVVNGAVKRAKSPAANSPQPKRRKVVRRKNVQMSEMAVQTSPGLKKNR